MSLGDVSLVAECTVFLYNNKKLFKWFNNVESLLKFFLTIFTPNSANPFGAGWNGA